MNILVHILNKARYSVLKPGHLKYRVIFAPLCVLDKTAFIRRNNVFHRYYRKPIYVHSFLSQQNGLLPLTT